jgi:hypothetical protein
MNQRVKLQVTCEMADVPSFSGAMLSEVTEEVSKLEKLISGLVEQLKNININSQQDAQKLQKPLMEMELARLTMLKIDSRLGETSSILGGLFDALTKPKEELMSIQKEQSDDNVSTG